MTAQFAPTGLLGLDQFEIIEYEAVLPAPLVFLEGWISIERLDTDTCYFYWVWSADGDDLGMVSTDGVLSAYGVSFSVCLVTVCDPIDGIACGTSVTNTTAGRAGFHDQYPCVDWDASGPEAVYRYVADSPEEVTITLSGLTEDLDLYVLAEDCRPGQCIAFGDNAVTFSAEAGVPYYVVVDGFHGAEGAFTLNVHCASDMDEGEIEGEFDPCAPDTEPPTLALVGEPAMTLYLCPGDLVPALPGAIAMDACKGDLTASIVVAGDVVTTAPGVYVQTYNVSDSSGNAAPGIKRVVTVETPVGNNIRLPQHYMTTECGDAFSPPVGNVRSGCGVPFATAASVNTVNTGVPGEYTVSYTYAGAEPVVVLVSVVDTVPPVLTLNGDADTTVDCGGAYVDAGAVAVDSCGGDLTEAVETDNPVDTGTPGVYTVTYTVKDASGNAATPVTRTVTVLDNCSACCIQGCQGGAMKVDDVQRFLGDYLLAGLSILIVLALRAGKRES